MLAAALVLQLLLTVWYVSAVRWLNEHSGIHHETLNFRLFVAVLPAALSLWLLKKGHGRSALICAVLALGITALLAGYLALWLSSGSSALFSR